MSHAQNLDIISYGVNIPNTNQSAYINANFRSGLSVPLLTRAEDFYVAVTRFSIPSSELPAFTFQKDTSSANPNLGTYKCTLTYLGFDATSTVIYVPDDTTLIPPPTSFIVGQIPFDRYYWVYSVQSTIDMFNTALAASLAALKAAFPFDVPLNAARDAYLLFSGGILSLIVPEEWRTLNINLNVNYAWYILMSGLEGKIVGAISNTKYFDVSLEARDNIYVRPNEAPTVPPLRQYEIEFVDWALWINVRQIGIFSNSLSTSGEVSPSLNELQSQSPVSTISPILADFNIDTQVNDEARGRVTFNQSGPWKVQNILNRGPLSVIDIQLFWISNLGQRMLIRIGPNDAAQVKLLFLRKEVYNAMAAKNAKLMG